MTKLFSFIFLLIIAGVIFWLTADISVAPGKITLPPADEAIVENVEAALESPNLSEMFDRQFNGYDLKLGEILASNSLYTRYFITYQSDQLKISGIMNVPAGDGPFPILILNHGYIDPKIYTNGRGLKREQDYLAQRGYVVIHPDYRNHAQSDKEENPELRFRLGYTEDVLNLIEAIKVSDLSFLDKENIGLLGHSMGGGVTENVLLIRPAAAKAAVLFAPVSADIRDNFNKWTKTRTEVAAEIIEQHGTFEDNPKFWDNISPINFVERIQTPIMIHHGTADKDVPLEWSQRFTTSLESAAKEVTFYTYENQPHEFTSAWPQVMARTVDFFDFYLKN